MKNEIVETGFSVDIVLECARGLSALWVFMFHICQIFEDTWPLIYAIARYGYQGVPVFFVISGYCIYAAAEKTLVSGQHPNTFLVRRLIRVLPPFWVSIVLLIALPFLLEAISFFKSGSYNFPSARWMHFTAIEWLEVITLTRIFFNIDGDFQAAFSPINAVYWSLAIELQLYLVMYATLFFKLQWKKLLVAVLIFSTVASFSGALNKSGLFFTFWPAFFFGIGLRWTHQHGITPWYIFGKNQKWASCLGTALFILMASIFIFSPVPAATFFLAQIPNLSFIAASAFSAAALWMLGGIEHSVLISESRQPKLFKASRTVLLIPLFWLGQSSYSLYLLHGHLQRLPDMFIRQIVSPYSALYPLLLITTTAFLCFVFYKFVEVPFQKIGRTFANRLLPSRLASKSLNVGQI